MWKVTRLATQLQTDSSNHDRNQCKSWQRFLQSVVARLNGRVGSCYHPCLEMLLKAVELILGRDVVVATFMAERSREACCCRDFSVYKNCARQNVVGAL